MYVYTNLSMREYELQQSTYKSAPHSVCVRVCVCVSGGAWRCVCACFTLAYACAILFNYRSGFEAEANSAVITGNTSFNILWKSTLCVSCTYLFSVREKNRRRKIKERERNTLRVCPTRSGRLLLFATLPLIPPLLLTVSHFRFVFPNGYAKRPLFPHF